MKKTVLILLIASCVKCQYERQIIPERCYSSAELLNRQCCVFPPFFKREIAKLCGAKFSVMFINNELNVTGLRREANNPCDHWKCILKRYSLLGSDEKLEEDKYFKHLDKWVKLNPEFSNVMISAKLHCNQMYRMFMPLKSCEFEYLQSCIRNFINVNCPKLMYTPECLELKAFYDECREFYIKK